jgi:PadR family transcriptional regulator, regulatory protein PadR
MSSRLTLREPTFFILLSLAQGQKHGYAILKDVETLSAGKLHLSTGTLYEALTRLLDQDLIARINTENRVEKGAPEKSANPGLPRKAYILTEAGWKALKAETEHMQSLIMLAHLRLGEKNT